MVWEFETVLLAIGNIFLIVGTVAIAAFGFIYSFSAPWWKSLIGRMFVLVSFAQTVSGATVLLGTFFGPDYLGRPVVRIVGYGAFAVAAVLLLTVYLIERRRPDPSLPLIAGRPVFVPPLVRLWRRLRGPKPSSPTDHTLVS